MYKIVIRDESGIYAYEPESKQRSIVYSRTSKLNAMYNNFYWQKFEDISSRMENTHDKWFERMQKCIYIIKENISKNKTIIFHDFLK